MPNMTDQEIRDWLKENTEARPYNADGEMDGNWNYIHRIKVSLLISELRKQLGG